MAKKPQNLSKEDKLKALEAALEAQGVDKTKFRRGGDFTEVEFIPTGQAEVDEILGDGHGIPRGTLVEICGETGAGKTYLSYKLMAEANKRGGWVCYVNAENSFYPPRAKALGVEIDDPHKFRLLENIETAEEVGEIVVKLVDSELYDVIVVDSVSALVPEVDFEKDFADNPKIGAHALFVKRLTKKLLGKCAKTKTIVILINQFYMANGKMPQQMIEQPTGGNAVKYFTHMRLWATPIRGAEGKVLNSQKQVVGGKSKLLVKKTRYGTPNVETVFPIMFCDAESDPITEFFYRAKAKPNEYVKEVRKTYKYIIPDTGEVVESKDEREMIRLLMSTPAPTVKTRGDDSENALEYICGRIKFTPSQMENLIAALDKVPDPTDTDEENGDDDEE